VLPGVPVASGAEDVGVGQVPEASMTARAAISVPSARRIRNGTWSRPAVRTRSMPLRAIPTTRAS
jgi:hypothetical protein